MGRRDFRSAVRLQENTHTHTHTHTLPHTTQNSLVLTNSAEKLTDCPQDMNLKKKSSNVFATSTGNAKSSPDRNTMTWASRWGRTTHAHN